MTKYSELNYPSVHRLGVGKAFAVGEQVALSILLQFLRNIKICLSCAVQVLGLSYQHLLSSGMCSSDRHMSKTTSPPLNL